MKDQFGTELRVGDKVAFGVTHKQPTQANIAVGRIERLWTEHWGGTYAAIRKDSTGQINDRLCARILWLDHA